jgi:hypothetical protein
MVDKRKLDTFISANQEVYEISYTDQKRLFLDWWKRQRDNLSNALTFYPGLEQEIIDDLVEMINRSDRTIRTVRKNLKNLPRGRPPKWDYSLLYVLLQEYEAAMEKRFMPRDKLLESLAAKYGFGGDNRIQDVEERITQARKEVAKRPLI